MGALLVPTATLDVDGTQYTLIEDFNALCEFERATGLDALNIQTFVKAKTEADGRTPLRDDDGKLIFDLNLNATQFRAYVWALLRSAHPDVKLGQVGVWLGNPNVYVAAREAMSDLATQQFTLLAGAQPDAAVAEGGTSGPLPG